LFNKFRIRIAEFCQLESPIQPEKEEFEVDESYFGSARVKGKRGRGAGLKTIVFGLYKRCGEVYTEIVPDCKSATLSAIIRGRADIESVIYSDGWCGYDSLVDLDYEKHFRVNHDENEFSKGNRNYINGIESRGHRLCFFGDLLNID
jgi:transposase-like protein